MIFTRGITDSDEPHGTLLIDHTGADFIIHSQEPHYLRVPKIYLLDSSPVLGKLIQETLDRAANIGLPSLPVLRLPDRGKILHNLFTFILPVTPVVPSTLEETLELLSVAQKYQMDFILSSIRERIAQHHPLPTGLEPALRIYSLARTYDLRPESFQAARIIGNYPMTIDDFDNMFNAIPCSHIYELWKYHEEVRVLLASDLKEFRESCASGILEELCYSEVNGNSSCGLPGWLDGYIKSIGKSPDRFHPAEFSLVMAKGIKDDHRGVRAYDYGSITSQTLRDLWAALVSVVNGSFEKAESALYLVQERKDPVTQINSITSPLELFDVPNADLIIRSSDSVDFRVHKPVLAMASPIFRDMFSLPQPSDSELFDGLPVVRLDEDSGLLNSLISILYPVRTVIPKSYEKVLYLLAACQKYDMDSVQSFIRAEVERGEFPAPKGDEVFVAYMIASDKGLIPELENAARQTLDHPLTYEVFGKGLEDWALRNLANFRRRYRDNLIVCLDSFLSVDKSGPSGIWVDCCSPYTRRNELAPWLHRFLSQCQNDLKLQVFMRPLDIHSRIRVEYLTALQRHDHCGHCSTMHAKNGFAYCAELENKLAHARDKVSLQDNDASL